MQAEPSRLVDNWLTRVEARQSKNTLQHKRKSVSDWREYLDAENRTLSEAQQLDVENFIDELLIDGYASRSVQTKAYDISAFYNYLKKRDAVDFNPVESINLGFLDGAKIDDKTTVRYIEIEEYRAMMDADIFLRDRVCIGLLWNTGVRAVEAVNIKLEDIDRHERSIEIRTAKKQTAETRTVWFSRRFDRLLTEWLDKGGRLSHIAGATSDFLLVSRNQSQMGSQRVSKLVREAAKQVDIQNELYTDKAGRTRHAVTPHTLRHSYAVHRTKRGMPIVHLQQLLGHSDIESTRIYLEFKQEDIRESERRYRP